MTALKKQSSYVSRASECLQLSVSAYREQWHVTEMMSGASLRLQVPWLRLAGILTNNTEVWNSNLLWKSLGGTLGRVIMNNSKTGE